MDIFFGSTATFIHNILPATSTPAKITAPRQPPPTPDASVDFSGSRNRQDNRSSGSIDSLGGGRII